MAFDPQAFIDSRQQTKPTESSFDPNKFLATRKADYYKDVFADEPSWGDNLVKGVIGEVGAINDFMSAIVGEFQTGAAGVPIMAGVDYVFSQANLWNENRKLTNKIKEGTSTKQEILDFVKLDKESTFKSAAKRADKSIRDKTAYLNPSKNSDLAMDYMMSKIGKEEEWDLVKKDLADLKNKSAVNRGLSWLGDNIHEMAKEIEQDTGLPSELGMAFTELLMLKSNTIAKPIVSIAGKTLDVTGVTGTLKRITGNSDLAQINKAIESRSKLEYDSKHLQEYKNAVTFGKITQTDPFKTDGKLINDIPFNLPPERFVKEVLQNTTYGFGKKVRETKTEQEAVEINELAGRGQQKLDNSYTNIITQTLTTKLNKLFGKNKENHVKVYDNIVDYMTWDSTIKTPRPKLTKVEQQIYKDIFEPGIKEYNRLIKTLHKAGKLERDIIIDSSKTGVFFPRRLKQQREGFFKNVLGDKFKINDPYARKMMPGSVSGREYFTLYNPITRERQVISLDKSTGPKQKGAPTNTILKASRNREGKKVFVKDRYLNNLNTGKGITKSGERLGPFEVREATRKELRDQTDLEYVQESPTVLYDRIAELRQMERDLIFEKNFVKSPYFKENAIKLKAGQALPEGFKKVTEDLTQSYKNLDKYYYKDRAAEILEDANRPRPNTILTKVSDALVKNMMLNPLPHMHNELIHFYSTKGFMRTWSPKARKQFKEDMMWAQKEVAEFGPTYRKALENGSSMMSTNIKNTTALDKIVRRNSEDFYSQPGQGKSFFAKMDRILNRRFGETYAKVSNNAQNIMWHTRDVMFMMLLRQKQRQYPNLSMKEHIQLVESHLPSYRIPIRVGEKLLGAKLSRSLSKLLQNQNLIIFARYKHGMVSSGLNTVRDILAPLEAPLRNLGKVDSLTQQKTPGKIVGEALADFIGSRDIAKGRTVKEQFKDGADSGLALASASFIIYPILDAIFQELFNSDEGHMRRAGILHVLDTATRVGEGSKNPYALFQNLATVNPTVMIGTELLLNTTFYNGRPIYNIDDPMQYKARDILKKLGTSVPLASQFVNADGAGDKVLGRQIDFKIKTDDQARSERRREKRRLTAKQRRETLRRLGLEED